MKYLVEIGKMIGLHPERWLDWGLCGAKDWIFTYNWWSGNGVLLFYLLFSLSLLLVSSCVQKWINQAAFFKNLAIVFFLCGITHFLHVQSRFTPPILVLSVGSYALVLMTIVRQLFLAKSFFNAVKGLKTQRQIEEIISEIEAKIQDLQKRNDKIEIALQHKKIVTNDLKLALLNYETQEKVNKILKQEKRWIT